MLFFTGIMRIGCNDVMTSSILLRAEDAVRIKAESKTRDGMLAFYI
jgi:hypothetical protein